MNSQIELFDNQAIETVDTGWSINRDCPLIMEATRSHDEDEYREQLKHLKMIESARMWWLGALASKGKEDIGRGAMVTLAEEEGYKQKTIWDAAYVYRQFDPKETSIIIEVYSEYPDLPWGVYKVVAPIVEQEEKLYWLKYAGEHNLSAPKLRLAMKQDEIQFKSFNVWPAFPVEAWQRTYPGMIPGQILSNVLHYTTNRNDLVVDVFGGGGNMGLACERMGRKCISFDIEPKYDGIERHNATQPFPDKCKDAQLVFLDPPYWNQKQGEYDTSPDDLSNKPLGEFYLDMVNVIKNAREILKPGGYCVLIIGSTQMKGKFYDHASSIYSLVHEDWELVNRISATYPTSQYSGADVENAKKNLTMLNLYTSLQFFRKQ
jgi:hypothetical protein